MISIAHLGLLPSSFPTQSAQSSTPLGIRCCAGSAMCMVAGNISPLVGCITCNDPISQGFLILWLHPTQSLLPGVRYANDAVRAVRACSAYIDRVVLGRMLWELGSREGVGEWERTGPPVWAVDQHGHGSAPKCQSSLGASVTCQPWYEAFIPSVTK